MALEYTVTDGAGATYPATFEVVVNPAPVLAAVADRSYPLGVSIPPLALAAAQGGTAPLGYTLAGPGGGALPAGLRFDATTRVLSGTPEAAGTTVLTYEVEDANGAVDTAQFTVGVPADTTAPAVVSVERHDGVSAFDAPTAADRLVFRVTFSEAVVDVGASDFAVTGTSGAGVTVVSGTGAAYVVTVSGGDLAFHDGAVGLTLASGHDVADGAGNALVAVTPTGVDERYSVDSTGPSVTLSRADGLGTTVSGSFEVTVRFVEANGLRTSGAGAFTAADLVVTHGAATVTATTDPLVWRATVTPEAGFEGTVLVDLPAERVRDVLGHGNTAAAQLGVPVDGVAPRLVSVVRADPVPQDTNADRLVFGSTSTSR